MSGQDPLQELTFAPGGPALAGAAWFSAVVDRSDLERAWETTAWPFRLALAQAWLLATASSSEDEAGQGRDVRAATVASGPPGEDWASFSAWRLERWRERTFRRFVEQGWGLVSLVEPVRPDVVLVRLGLGRDGRRIAPGERVVAQALTMQLVDGRWMVAGVGRALAVPGWPPTEEVLPTDLAG